MGRPEYDETTGAKLIYGHDGVNDQAVHTTASGDLIIGGSPLEDISYNLHHILIELKVISSLLNHGLNANENLDLLRHDEGET